MMAPTLDGGAFWRCRVDCWYVPHRSLGAKRKANRRVIRFFIVGPCSSDEAMAEAAQRATDTAEFSKGREWAGFECIEAYKVTFPLEIVQP